MTTKTIPRKTKGLIAAIAGGALLLGTGATFAVWTHEDTIDGATIVAGQLSVEASAIDWTFSTAEWDEGEWVDDVMGPTWVEETTEQEWVPGAYVSCTDILSPTCNLGYHNGSLGYWRYVPGHYETTTIPGFWDYDNMVVVEPGYWEREPGWRDGDASPLDFASYTMIPGHTVMGEFTVTPNLVGTGLVADLTVNGDTTSGFSDEVEIGWLINGVPTNSIDDAFEHTGLTPADSGTPITIQVVLTMPREPVHVGHENADNNAPVFRNGEAQWNLSEVGVTLTQQ